MAKQINIFANLIDKQLKKQLQALQNGKYNINVNVNNANVGQTSNQVHQLSRSANSANSAFGKLGSTISETFSTSRMTMTAFLAVMNEIRKAGKNAQQTIQDLDKAITDLSIATNMSRENTAKLVKNYNDYAKELKSTTTQVTSAADDYLRAGKSMNEAQALIKDSIMLSKLGQIDSGAATEDLLATMNGFNMSVEETGKALDAMVAVDMEAATSAGDIATALKYCASSADVAGVSFNKLVGMIGATQDKTQQSAETIGTFTNTILSRYRDVKIGKYLSEDGDDISDYESVLKSIGVSLRDNQGEFRDFELILGEMAKKWDYLSSTEQNALIKVTSGTRQANRMIALLEGYNKVLELTEVAANSAGTAVEKFNNSYTNSLEAKKNTLQASFESMIVNSDMDSVYSGILEATTALVEFIDKTNALKGVFAGLATSTALKFFMSAKTGAKEAYLSLNQFSNALKIVKQTNIPTGDFDRLLLLSKNLSSSQMKLLLSSKNLTLAQKEQILVNSGLSAEEAKLQLQTWGMATAQNGLTVATTSLSNAFRGLIASMVANPIILLTTLISSAVMAYQSYAQKLEETRKKNIEAGEAAKENADSLRELYLQYEKLNGITNKTESQEEQFKQVVLDVTAALGGKASALESLVAGTDEYTKALKNATKAELETQYASAKVGAKAAADELKKTAYGNVLGSKITITQNEQSYSNKEHMAALNAVKDILKEYESVSLIGQTPVLEWEPVNWDVNQDDMNSVVEYYQVLIKAREKLATSSDADFLMSSDIYKDINTTINDLSDAVEKYTEQQYQALKLNYEWQNGIPTTEKEFKKMETSILNASGAGKEFQSILKGYLNEDFATFSESTNSIDNMADAVDNATQSISGIKSFSQAWEELKVSTDDSTKKLADNLTELAEKGRLTTETFSQADTSGYFDGLGISADEAVNKINAMVDSATQLKSISDQISKMSDMLADKKNGTTASASDLAGFDATVKGLESWEEFERVMGSSKSSMEECQQAADALATEWVNNGNFLANLTEENKQFYITQLDNMGVMNAEALVTDRLTTAQLVAENTEKALSAATADLSDKQASYTQRSVDAVNATYENSAALANQEGMTNVARVALADLVAQQTIFSNQDLGVSDKIAALGELAGAYMGAAAQASFLNKTQGGLNSNYRISAEDAWAQVKDEFSKLDTTIVTPVIKPTGSSTYKTKSGGKDSKTTIDWIERRVKSLNDHIDLTQSKLENLSNIKSPKNLSKKIDDVSKKLKAASENTEKWKNNLSKIKIPESAKKLIQSGKNVDLSKYSKSEQKNIKKYQSTWKSYSSAKKKENSLYNQKWDLETQRGKEAYLKSQEKDYNTLAKVEEKAYKKYMSKAKSVKLSDSLKKKVQSGDYNISDYSSKQQELIQEYQKWWDKAQDSLKGKQDAKKNARDKKIEQYQLVVDNAEAKIARSQARAELDTGNYKEQNKHLEYQKKYLKEQYEAEIEIAKVKKDKVEVARLEAELQKELNDLTKQEFDNIANTYDNKIGLADNKIQAFQSQIDLLEARGQQVGSALYTKQMTLNNGKTDELLAEKDKLIKKLAEIPKGSDSWYDAEDKLFAVDSALNQIQIDNANLQKSINQLKFDRFDDLLAKLNDIVDETDFLIDMLDSDNFYDDNGKITDDGITAMGMYAQKYDVLLSEAEKYKEQMAQLESDYQNDIVDPETYESKMREYKQGQMDMISSANAVKKSIVSLVKEGLDAQNDALEREIENRKKLLSEQKASRDFNKKMLDLNKEIARTERQLAVLNSGADDSEENRKKVRELKSKLEDLKSDREDTLYDKSIEDQEKSLDTLLENSKKQTEDYLSNTEVVFISALNEVNANTETVSKNIERISKETGYDISQNITNAWNGAGNAVSSFGTTISSTTPGIISQISLITEQMTRLAEEAEKASQALVNATESNYGEHTTVGADNKQNTTKTGDFVIGSISSVGDVNKLRNVKNYIEGNIDKPGRKDISTYHPLNQYIYKQTGGIITTSKQSGLAKALGINNIGSNPTDADKDRILKALKAAGFSNGGFVDAKTLIRSTGEDGIVLARHGEAILTPEQSRALLQIAPVLPKMLDVTNMVNNIPVRSNGAQAPVYNIDNSITVEGIATNEIVKDMENVATRQAEKVVTKINNMSYAKGVRRR